MRDIGLTIHPLRPVARAGGALAEAGAGRVGVELDALPYRGEPRP